jgi:exopolysaccharide biosynthesis polyprenyl glycosylphosphotransferase
MGVPRLDYSSKATITSGWYSHAPVLHRDTGSHRKRVLVVGANVFGRRIAAKLESTEKSNRTVIGFIDHVLAGPRVLGTLEELATVARRTFADEIVFAGMPLSPALRAAITQMRQEQVDVIVVPEPVDDGGTELQCGILAGLPALILHRNEPKRIDRLAKRLIDILGSCMGLLLLSPLFLIASIIIKLDSPGPILYPHIRVGFRGRQFRCFKFRTMILNANSLKHQLRHLNELGNGFFFKIRDDPRLTTVGRRLRHYSIDELPQLWNVLRGEMSLVGPRPSPIDEYEWYTSDHLARLRVKPGITGLWQILGRRDPDFERAMKVDRQYVQSWSVWLDLKILWKTLAVVAQGQ